MNAVITIVPLLGAEPVDRQAMLDEMLGYVYAVNGSEARQATESWIRELDDKELGRVHTAFRKAKRQMDSLFDRRKWQGQSRSGREPYTCVGPRGHTVYVEPQECDRNEKALTDKEKAEGWTSYIGPRGHTVFVAPMVTEPGFCTGESSRSFDWYRAKVDPEYRSRWNGIRTR